MMNFTFLQISLFVLLAATALRLPSGYISRDGRLLGLNAAFLAIYFSGLREVLPVFAFTLLGYGALRLVRHLKVRGILAAALVAIILLYVWLKQYPLVKAFLPFSLGAHPFQIVGLSYILFRVIHLLVDCKEGTAPFPTFLRYVNYCYFAPGFISGPIQRFQDFQSQVDRPLPPLTVPVLHAALGRIMLGTVMTLGISAVAANAGLWAQDGYYSAGDLVGRSLGLSAAAVCYLVYIFSNFAGYMHLVIGFGKICGFDVPENFDRPYAAKNFLDLWARWHITLSEWFKFYLFNPLLKLLVGKWESKSLGPYLAAIAFFFTFLVMGIWHGTRVQFVAYGAFLGFGAMLNKAWQVFLGNRLGRTAYRDLLRRPWYGQISRALTLSYFALSLTCLWVDPARLSGAGFWRVSQQAAMSLLAVSVVFFSVGLLVDGVLLRLQAWLTARVPLPQSEFAMIVPMAVKVALGVYILLLAGSSAPEFIYKDF